MRSLVDVEEPIATNQRVLLNIWTPLRPKGVRSDGGLRFGDIALHGDQLQLVPRREARPRVVSADMSNIMHRIYDSLGALMVGCVAGVIGRGWRSGAWARWSSSRPILGAFGIGFDMLGALS